jgi:hypothetical protein
LPQECAHVVDVIRAAKAKLLEHLAWINDGLPLLDNLFVAAVTARPAGQAPETVVATCPPWLSTLPVPESWVDYATGMYVCM